MPKFGSGKRVNTDVARKGEAKPSRATASFENGKVNAAKTPVPTARKAPSGGWVSQWGSKLSSLVSQKPRPTRSAIPRFNGVPVQGELSLDNIKVIRNDLSDADLEVVTRRTTPTEILAPAFRSPNSPGRADKNVGGTGQASNPEKPERLPEMFSAVKP